METRTIEVGTADGAMPVYEAVPAGAPRGGVVVVQEAFGVNEHIEDVTRRFAGAGYHSVAPHLFHRAGGGVVPYGQFDQVMEKFRGISDDTLLADVDATVAVLAAAGIQPGRTGIVGFCMGGRVTFLVAAHRTLGAAVGFYGGGIVTSRFPQLPALVGHASSLQTPWLGLFGDLDPSIPVDDVEELRSACAGGPVDTDVVRYADSGHGFFRDVADDYRPEAAEDAWRRTLEWLSSHLS